jgi:hypothetical protein
MGLPSAGRVSADRIRTAVRRISKGQHPSPISTLRATSVAIVPASPQRTVRHLATATRDAMTGPYELVGALRGEE